MTNQFDGLLIKGQATELIEKLKSQREKYPKVIEIFLKILEKHYKKHPLLEDWLIIRYYLDIWVEQYKIIEYLESIFNELAIPYPNLWEEWVKEVVEKTNKITTHEIFNSVNDYLLQIFAAIWLIREGYSNLEFPSSKSKGKSVDIIAYYKERPFAIECKFIKSSEKFKSYFRRLYLACRKCENIPILFAEQFNFPPAKKIKEIGPKHYDAIKTLLKKVIKNKDELCEVELEDKEDKKIKFAYLRGLPTDTCPIGMQTKYAEECSFKFAQRALKNTIDTAVKQLQESKYDGYKKIIFMNLQTDSLYCITWTETAIKKIKHSTSKTTLCKHDTFLIFSNDVGFFIDL